MEIEKEQERKKRQVLIDERINQWKMQKHIHSLEAKRITEQKESERKREDERKARVNQEKVNDWTKKKSHRGKSNEPILNRKPWVCPIDTESQEEKLSNQGRQTILSPPKLYKEYEEYKKNAPEFLRKYGTHVSMAGKVEDKKERKHVLRVKEQQKKNTRIAFRV